MSNVNTQIVHAKLADLYAALRSNYAAGHHVWIETTEEIYYEQLGSLPPRLYIAGGFLVGECAFDNADGVEVFAAFIRYEGQYFARYLDIETARDFTSLDAIELDAFAGVDPGLDNLLDDLARSTMSDRT